MKLRKVLSIILVLAIIFSLIPVKLSAPTQASTAINIGDYVQMGKYYDEPILWRCVDIDENGPLMLADRILTIKPFDAAGDHKYLDGTPQEETYGSRTGYGSNLWETSNMRSWLNSTATSGNVTWLDGCPPTADMVWDGYDDYATEKGFLAEGNFTVNEQNAIKSVTQKSLLNSVDVAKLSIGGTALHTWEHNISTVVQNYDTAYYQNVTDKMFLLDIKQLNRIYQNSNILGTNYYIGKPTQKAVDNADHKDGSYLTTNDYWFNWNRSPISDSGLPHGARVVRYVGYDDYEYAYGHSLGARPAFYINLSSVVIESGNGSMEIPYVVDNTRTKAFPDVNPDNFGWAQESVEYLAGLNIINGSAVDGQLMYLPENTITRAELCKLIVAAYGFTQEGEAKQFADVDGIWAVDYIAIASSLQIVRGYEDNTFKPEAGISRQELAVMISRAMRKKNIGSVIPEEQVNEKLVPFLDQAGIDDWARSDVAYSVEHGIIKGSPVEGGGFNFLPLDTANRAETAVMIYRMLEDSFKIVDAYMTAIDQVIMGFNGPGKGMKYISVDTETMPGLADANKAELLLRLRDYGENILDMSFAELDEQGYIKDLVLEGGEIIENERFEYGVLINFNGTDITDTCMVTNAELFHASMAGVGYMGMKLEYVNGEWEITDTGRIWVT